MSTRILIVDDEEGMRFTLKSFLEEEGHQVFTAGSCSEALQIISATDLDLVFSDIVLGSGTGIDVLCALKEINPNCPVVMITGYPDIGTASDAVRLGAFDYLPKPVVQETLLRTTHLALKHKAVVDEREVCLMNMEAILRSVKDAIVTIDSDMKVIQINEAAQRICSLSTGVMGESLDEIKLHCSGNCLNAVREAIQKKEYMERFRLECHHESHDCQVVNISIFPLINRLDNFSGAVMVAKDETRLAFLERDLSERGQFQNLIGESEGMQKVYDLIESLWDVQTTVLILGESGTGKELVAEALALGGQRNGKPFVKVNCGALPDNLLESELFGHVKGAFTGAMRDKAGRFQMADGGTIFLDEIGNISQRMQLNLLRVLQESEFERVGDSNTIRVDVRVIAATNQDLAEKIRQGDFREDLYYRLNVVKVSLPPLRERTGDVPLLVKHFLGIFNEKLGKQITGASDDVMRVFMAYPWPGNVRELKHAIEHSFILCRHNTITLESLPSELNEFGKTLERTLLPSVETVGQSVRDTILAALETASWNKAKASRILGISQRTIHRKIKELRIEEHETRTDA